MAVRLRWQSHGSGQRGSSSSGVGGCGGSADSLAPSPPIGGGSTGGEGGSTFFRRPDGERGALAHASSRQRIASPSVKSSPGLPGQRPTKSRIVAAASGYGTRLS